MGKLRAFVTDERRLLLAVLLIVVLLNVPYGRYALYPFMILSTWVHEMCHGVAALLIGGGVDKLEVYPDGSGLAFTRFSPGAFSRAWVSSAGYMGTSVIGALLLVFRRRPLAGRIGIVVLGALMLVSTLLFVRNLFGLLVVPLIGLGLGAVGLFKRNLETVRGKSTAESKLGDLADAIRGRVRQAGEGPASWLFSFVAATLCLNAITSIQVLFSSNLVVNGSAAGGSDAHSVAEALLLPYWFWAGLWMVTSLLLMLVAIKFTLPGKPVAAVGGTAPSSAAADAA